MSLLSVGDRVEPGPTVGDRGVVVAVDQDVIVAFDSGDVEHYTRRGGSTCPAEVPPVRLTGGKRWTRARARRQLRLAMAGRLDGGAR